MDIINRLLYSPINVQMVVTRTCNLSCNYCNEFTKKPAHVPTSKLKKQITKVNDLGAFSLNFTGGEPLLHPDIFEIIKFSKKYHMRINLLTNGFLLTKESILNLNESGLDGLQISIDGVKPNKNTKKVLKYLKNKLILLKKYAKFRVNINVVLGSTDPKEVLEVINFNNSLRFKTSLGLIHDEDGQICINEKYKKEYFKIDKIRRKPFWDFHKFEKNLIEKGEQPFKCRAGGRYLYIDEFGYVNLCSQKRGLFKKPLMEYTLQDLKTRFYTYKPCSKKCTIGCVRRASSLDGERKQYV